MSINQTKKIVFIEWSKYNSRGASFSASIGAKIFFIGTANVGRNPLRSFLTYFPKTLENIKILNRENPEIIIITNTTWIIAIVNYLYARIRGKKLLLDSHSCAFDDSWLKYPIILSKYFAKNSFMSFVTNAAHVKLVQNWGAEVLLLNDIPFEDGLKTSQKLQLSEKFNICYVCTFAEDEPFEEVFRAAERLSDITLYVTGKFDRVNIDPQKYPNIKFLGFVNNDEYKLYINNADAIMTLTTREDTMQRAGSEAISVGKPLITSDTQMLRNTFKFGTIFVKNLEENIKLGMIQMKDNSHILAGEMAELQDRRKEEFLNKVELIKNKLEK